LNNRINANPANASKVIPSKDPVPPLLPLLLLLLPPPLLLPLPSLLLCVPALYDPFGQKVTV